MREENRNPKWQSCRKQIRVVASDFDGTLLKNGAQQADAELFVMIERLWEKGIRFIAASGRQYPNLYRMLEPVADKISFICENGALVMENGTVLARSEWEETLEKELLADLKRIPDSEILVSGKATSYIVPHTCAYEKMLRETVRNDVTTLASFEEIPEPVIKIAVYWPGGVSQEWKTRLTETYRDRLHVVESGGGWLDFTLLGTDKGKALAVLAEKQGFGLEQVVSFGDSENDMTMLREAGCSFAMDSAPALVKSCADGVCSDVIEVLRELTEEEPEPEK